MTLNQSGWRPEMGNASDSPMSSFTGNRALMLEEALIFEIGDSTTTGVDLAEAQNIVFRFTTLGVMDYWTGGGLPGAAIPASARRR